MKDRYLGSRRKTGHPDGWTDRVHIDPPMTKTGGVHHGWWILGKITKRIREGK